jgi:hypothetical protein
MQIELQILFPATLLDLLLLLSEKEWICAFNLTPQSPLLSERGSIEENF